MKRLLICLCLVGVLAFPATAAASKRKFHGTVDEGGTMGFTLVKKNGVRKVKNFHWDNVPMICDQGKVTDGGSFFPMKVKNGSFKGTGFLEQATAKVAGTFSHHYKEEDGTIQVFGDFPIEGLSGCDTGLTHHHAD